MTPALLSGLRGRGHSGPLHFSALCCLLVDVGDTPSGPLSLHLPCWFEPSCSLAVKHAEGRDLGRSRDLGSCMSSGSGCVAVNCPRNIGVQTFFFFTSVTNGDDKTETKQMEPPESPPISLCVRLPEASEETVPLMSSWRSADILRVKRSNILQTRSKQTGHWWGFIWQKPAVGHQPLDDEVIDTDISQRSRSLSGHSISRWDQTHAAPLPAA